MTHLRIFGLVFGFVLALTGIAQAASPEIPKPKRFELWYISAKESAQIVVGIILHEVDGRIAICGALWPADERGDSTASRERFYKSVVKVRGKIIPATLTVFPLYATREAAKTFRCSVSDEVWQGPYRSNDFRLRLPEIPESD
ncbi:MAG: hypothetical protein ACT4OK_07965 [Gemmobacter sp.]